MVLMEAFRCHAHELKAVCNVWNPDDPIRASLSPSDLPSKSEFQLEVVSSIVHRFVAFTEENPTTSQPVEVFQEPHHFARIIHVDRLYSAEELFGIISSALLKSHDELRGWSGLNSLVSDIIQKVHRLIVGTECNNLVRVGVDFTRFHVCYESILIQELLQRLLAEENDGMKPASKSATMEMLKRVDFDKNQIHSDDDETCTVCLEELGRDEVLCMPCSHRFHASCILKWLDNSHYCPICRFEMPTQ